MPTVEIPHVWRSDVDGNSQVAVSGDTIETALINLVVQHPEFLKRLFSSGTRLVPHVAVFVNGVEVGYLPGGLKTALHEGDAICILTGVAGG